MNAYQQAKARFGDLPEHQRPHSLSRRNGTLISCYICPRWDKRILARMLKKEIVELFPHANIQKVTVDRWHIGRVYFSLP